MSQAVSYQPARRRERTRCEPTIGLPVCWSIGDWASGEFATLRQQMDPACAWIAATDLEEAIASEALRAAPPEVVLLAQPRPGCIDQAAVDRLLAVAPLVRVVVVAGSWCEGELRNGRPLVGASRLYWHEAAAWWALSLERRRAGLAPAWSGPAEREPATDERPAGGVVAVDAIDFAVFETLADALRPYGWACAWTSRGRGDVTRATCGIWDGGQLDDDEVATLAAFVQRLGAGRCVIALVDYPRAEHPALVRGVGAAAVLGKPYAVASLVHELRGMMASSP